MRLPVLFLLVALSLPGVAIAQDTNETPTTNETSDAGNETTTGSEANETPDAETPAGPITITMTAHQEGSALYFMVEGDTRRNPTITVAPGQQVTFHLRIVSGVHNLNVNNEAKTDILSAGDEATIEWTAPAEGGTVEYWCDPHRSAGMRGRVQVGAAPAPGGGGEEGEISGDTIDLGQYSDACQGRVAPAAAAQGIVGLPTLQDYIDACTPQEGPVEVQKHAADYVLPISWGLIGLGIAAVVWVHKSYKP